MPSEIESAETVLNEAEIEFSDGAFAPFWDKVESAANSLARFDLGIRNICDNSRWYNARKKELDSSPPPFQIKIDTLPSINSTVERMQKIVRRAQKDFQFSTIYEQRKTNKSLVQGFTSLGQAINEVGSRIASSMDDLDHSISEIRADNQRQFSSVESSIESSIESLGRQIESDSSARRDHEKKVNKKLDNIKNQ